MLHNRMGIRVGLIVMVLLSGLSAKEIAYRLVFQESMRSVWKTDVDPTVTISSSSRLKLHDKVEGKRLQLSRGALPLGVDSNNMADFCIEMPGEPICREVIISDFSYEGVEGVLQGNRGERLHYIVLAECKAGERTCRYPHLKLGPNPIFKLLKEGVRVHTLDQEGRELIVTGPYPKKKAAAVIKTVKALFPDAFLR